MSDHIGAGYGSEYHLMRYMARYRDELNNKIENKIGGTILNWLDFKHKNKKVYNPSDPAKVILPDQELEGLEFINGSGWDHVLEEWKVFWPQDGTQHNWDAVAKISIDSYEGWLLVEAKAHTKEIESTCGAKSPGSIKKIALALQNTKDTLGIQNANDWKEKYYQYANRLAILCFLREHGVMAKLLFIYFLGDKHQQLSAGSKCPKTSVEWQPFLEKQKQYLGVTDEMKRHCGIHEIFLDVAAVGQ